MKYVIIEQDEDCEAYITHVEAENVEEAINNYSTMGLGIMLAITEEAFNNMCIQGAGAK